MKKYLFFLLTLVVASFAFMSCSSDDDDNDGELSKSEIVGTWMLKEVKTSASGSYMAWPYKKTTATFKSDGTYRGAGYFGTGSGTWKKKGNTVNTYIDGELYVSYEVISLTSSYAEMKMTISGSSFGGIYKQIICS